MARRGENIYKRKDGRWEGRYIAGRKENGQARYQSVYARSYRDVKQKIDAAKAVRRPQKNKACPLTMEALSEQWLERVRCTVKESTYARYTALIDRHILPAMGEMRADQLTANFLSQFVNAKLLNGRLDGKGGLSPKTVQDITVIIKAILKTTSFEYGIPNCASTVRLPKTRAPETKTLERHELCRLETLLRSSPNNSNLGLLLCMYTGIRLGEVCALRWSDIDWQNGTLHIHKTVIRLPQDGEAAKTHLIVTAPKTKRAERMIPLPLSLLTLLRAAAAGQDPNAYITTGLPERLLDPRTYQYRFHSILKRLGIEPVKFHALRHTFATQCVQQGMDIKTLSEILGHATVQMTLNRYVHSSLEMKKRQMDQLCFTTAV